MDAAAWLRVASASTISKACAAKSPRASIEERTRTPFASIRDLVRRVPAIRKEEMNSLAQAGALNFIRAEPSHRREALWDSELAARPVGELLEVTPADPDSSPLLASGA